MKTCLILLLSLALAAAALMTRPGKREFMLYLLDSRTAEGSAWNSTEIDHAARLIQGLSFKDRFLWTDVEKDGKVVYTGVFSHWFTREKASDKTAPNLADLAKLTTQ